MFSRRPLLTSEQYQDGEDLVLSFSQQPRERDVLEVLLEFCTFLGQQTGRHYFVSPHPSWSPRSSRKPAYALYHYGDFAVITTDFFVYRDHSQRFSLQRHDEGIVPPSLIEEYVAKARSSSRRGFFQHFLEGLSRKIA